MKKTLLPFLLGLALVAASCNKKDDALSEAELIGTYQLTVEPTGLIEKLLNISADERKVTISQTESGLYMTGRYEGSVVLNDNAILLAPCVRHDTIGEILQVPISIHYTHEPLRRQGNHLIWRSQVTVHLTDLEEALQAIREELAKLIPSQDEEPENEGNDEEGGENGNGIEDMVVNEETLSRLANGIIIANVAVPQN
ncbi:MAG: hypothetical protein IKS01_00625 [Paludibacteraceae bacterium]|nr:hypothetical protein [Paludibacteraceae bacterium]